MGNYRFKLSDMIPNAWFYKLKDMRKPISSSTTNKKQSSSSTSSSSPQKQPKTDQPHNSYPRKSYYFTRDRDHLVIPSLDNLRISPSPSASPLSRAHYPSPPRKSSKQRRVKRKPKGSSPRTVTSTISAGCNCRATATVDSVWSKPDSPTAFSSSSASESTDSELSPPSPMHEFRADPNLGTHSFDKMVSWSTSCQCKAIDSNASDKSPSVSRKTVSFDSIEYDLVREIELPQIVTKPLRFTDMVQSLKTKDDSVKPKSLSVKVVEQESIKVKEQSKTRRSSSSSTSNSGNTTTTTTTTATTTSTKSSNRRFSVSSPSTRVKINSPRLGSRRNQGRKSVSSSSTSSSSSKSTSRRSLSVSDSFAVVKSSFDPQKDFRESMVEMIVQNNIKGSKELEDLLACYLSLNSDEYHDLIIKVFKQIWFDLCDFQLN